MSNLIFNSLFYFVFIGTTNSCISSYFIASSDADRFDIDIMNNFKFLVPYYVSSTLSFTLMSYMVNRQIIDYGLFVKSIYVCVNLLSIIVNIYIYNSLEKIPIFILLIIILLFLGFYFLGLMLIIKHRKLHLLLSLPLVSIICLILAGLK
jgi:hypothetical protein